MRWLLWIVNICGIYLFLDIDVVSIGNVVKLVLVVNIKIIIVVVCIK